MTGCILIRYSEIGLKGNNKNDFELKLIRNINSQLKKEGIKAERIKRLFSRILIITDKTPDLTSVFGIASYSTAKIVPLNTDDMKKHIASLIKDYNKDISFRISAKRLDKEFHLDSMGIERELGSFVVEKTGAKVNLKNFDKEIGLDILRNEAIIFNNRIKGPGGLPAGIEGNALALIENKDSVKAAILAMKRGCDIFPVGFKKTDIFELEKYSPKKLSFELISSIEELDKYGEKVDAKAVIVGQKLESFKDINTKLMVLRPLISL